jgi:putative restriction endonuclease
LEKGFLFNNEYVTLVGPQGIWKPRMMSLPISITTTSNGPYSDSFTKDGFLNYRYRGTDPSHSSNVGLRQLMREKKPLIYFHSVVRGEYVPAWPVFIQADDISDLTFTVALDTAESLTDASMIGAAQDEALSYGRRSYVTATYRHRLHQSSFRLKVLRAYQNQCTLCNLKHRELLDAAHIIEDKHEQGDPIVTNGLSLCKIHHAAFDANIIGITPDYVVKVRDDILIEIDGPMLKHGLQSLDNNKIGLPHQRSNWPDRGRLEMRYARFLFASA